MDKLAANGVLRHRFFGEYSAVVALGFESESAATEANSVLGSSWQKGKNNQVLIWKGSSEELDHLKEKLKSFNLQIKPCGWRHCKKQCKDATIDSLAHSMDVGPEFTVEIPVQCREQMSLF